MNLPPGHSPPPALRVGDVFAGRYRVVRELASGGMGAVFVVEHLATSALHALKVMHPELVESEAQRNQFLKEARIAALIDDPEHIVDVTDAGVDPASGLPYLVMELLQGRELGELLRERGRLSPSETVRLMQQLAAALTSAHAKGVVHRDLKPENLFVVQRANKPMQLKVLDFGIAKVLAGTRGAGTLTGGTAHYMAPEQTKPRADISARTDLMAFGLICFRLLVGRTYWLGDDVQQVYGELLASSYEPATSRAARYGVALPPAFDTFFARTVQPNPDARVATAAEAYQLLEASLAHAHDGSLLAAPSHVWPAPGESTSAGAPAKTAPFFAPTPAAHPPPTAHPPPAPAGPPPTLRTGGSPRRWRWALVGSLVVGGAVAGAWIALTKPAPWTRPRPTATATAASAASADREARDRLAAIRAAVSRGFRSTKQLCPSAPPVPASMPTSAPVDVKAEPFGAAGWSCLSYSHTGPQRYQVEYRKGGPYKASFRGGPDPGPRGFEISAEGDTDGDGITSLYVVTGVVDAAGELVVRDDIFVAAPGE